MISACETRCNELLFPFHPTLQRVVNEATKTSPDSFASHKGSAAELRTQVYIARKIGLIADAPYLAMLDELKQIAKMLTGLRRSLNTEN